MVLALRRVIIVSLFRP